VKASGPKHNPQPSLHPDLSSVKFTPTGRPSRPQKVRFAPDSALEGGFTSELVSGIRRRASIWHFIPA
jgi:hypothetical protein